MFIVIGEEHYTTLGAVRTLGEMCISPVVILVGGGRPLVSRSKYPSKIWYTGSYKEAVDRILASYGSEAKKPVVIANGDMTVKELDARFDELKDKFIFNNAGSAGRVGRFQNKETLNSLGEKYGLNIARSWRVKKEFIPEDIEYPVITKPLESYVGWKKDYHVCFDEDELKEAYGKLKCEELLLQLYVSKATERTYEGVSCNRGSDVLFAIQTRYTYSLPDCYSMEMDVMEPDSPEIERALRGMFAEIGFEGVFEVEFIEDTDGRLWFLEINFRNSTWSYVCTKLEMPLPIIWAEGMIEGGFPPGSLMPVPPGFRALAEVPDFEQRVRRFKMIGVAEWIRSVRSADCLFFYSAKDIKPFLSVWVSKLIGLVRKPFKFN